MKLSDLVYHSFLTLGAETKASAEDVSRGVLFPNAIYVTGGLRVYHKAQSVLSEYNIETWGECPLGGNRLQFSADADARQVVKILSGRGFFAWSA